MVNVVVGTAVARSLADLLRDLLKDELISLLGVRQNVEDIQNKLILIRRSLEDADKKQTWVSELREIVYDTEDVVRTFSIKTGFSKPVKRYAWYLGQLPYLHKVVSEIKAKKAKISSLVEVSNLIPVGENSSSSGVLDPMQYSHEMEDIVGLKHDIKELVADLVDDGRHGSVDSIYVMAGIGKTTLAKQLYHNDDIRRYFDCLGWAYISQQFKQEDAWKEILCDLVSPSKEEKENIKGLSKKELAKKLYDVQMEKKCLLIFDDIWTDTESGAYLC